MCQNEELDNRHVFDDSLPNNVKDWISSKLALKTTQWNGTRKEQDSKGARARFSSGVFNSHVGITLIPSNLLQHNLV